MHRIYFRISPDREWQPTRKDYGYGGADALNLLPEFAREVEAALKLVGYPFAQAEARPVEAEALTETAVTRYRCRLCHKFLRSDEKWQIVDGGLFAHKDCFTPEVEGEHGETPPDGYGACDLCHHAPAFHIIHTNGGDQRFCAKCRNKVRR